MKRLFDIVCSIILLVLLIPVFIVVGIVIRIKIGSPIIFKHKRPGLNERVFVLYKFRTMADEIDGFGNMLTVHERLNRTGKWLRKISLDELPQLFNVLKGDLSLVGPRPLLIDYLKYYSEEQSRRHHVKPGITGWAQINGRNNISWEEKFQLDVWYVDNHSFVLDLKILLITIIKVFKSEGVSKDGYVTTDTFYGMERKVSK